MIPKWIRAKYTNSNDEIFENHKVWLDHLQTIPNYKKCYVSYLYHIDDINELKEFEDWVKIHGYHLEISGCSEYNINTIRLLILPEHISSNDIWKNGLELIAKTHFKTRM